MWTYKYALISLVAVIATFLIHELTHWVMGELLGYDMVMTLNTGYPGSGAYNVRWHYTVITAVGPLITLLQAFTFYKLIRKYADRYLYPFLFECFYLELFSGVLNLRNPNDLGRLSTTFNLPLLTLPLIFLILQTLMVYGASRRLHLDQKFNLVTLFWVIFYSHLWIGANQLFHVVLIG